jgi:hypothetical protein
VADIEIPDLVAVIVEDARTRVEVPVEDTRARLETEARALGNDIAERLSELGSAIQASLIAVAVIMVAAIAVRCPRHDGGIWVVRVRPLSLELEHRPTTSAPRESGGTCFMPATRIQAAQPAGHPPPDTLLARYDPSRATRRSSPEPHAPRQLDR